MGKVKILEVGDPGSPFSVGPSGTLGNEPMVASSLSPGQVVSSYRPPSQVYVDLIYSYNNAGEYSTCFTELQRDFIISRPTKLKSLIRLVKHWYRQVWHKDGPPYWETLRGGGGGGRGLVEQKEGYFLALGAEFASL